MSAVSKLINVNAICFKCTNADPQVHTNAHGLPERAVVRAGCSALVKAGVEIIFLLVMVE
jgi:hypothetical protein